MATWEELEKAGTTWADLSGVTWAELEETCEKGSSNIAQKDLEDRDGEYPIYGASGFIKNVDFYQQETPYIAVVKDGAGVGRVMRLPAKSSVIGTMQYILPKNNVDTGYLAYALEHMNLSKYYTGATIPHIYFKDYKKEKFPLPPLDEQRRIAAVLDKVSGLIAKRREQLDKLDELVKARFLEMFGDPVSNPKGWNNGTIRDVVSEVKYGTSRPAVDGGTYKYLRMGNITFDGHLDLSDLKYIDIPDSELEKCMVRKGDVLFNRTNSKELVGKTCVFDLDEPMVIAGYIIRVRVNKKVLPIYLSAVLNSQYGKQILADMCKAIVGQANINAQELQDIAILIPPIELQEKFSDYAETIKKSKLTIQQSLDKLEVLKKALMQQYFG